MPASPGDAELEELIPRQDEELQLPADAGWLRRGTPLQPAAWLAGKIKRQRLAVVATASGLLCLVALVAAWCTSSFVGEQGSEAKQGSVATAVGLAASAQDAVPSTQQEWQCDGGPGIGEELVSRLMDPASKTARVRCCKCYGTGKLGVSPKPCSGLVSWKEARQICMEHGLRLCTKEELENGEAAKTGCGFDDEFAWATHTPYGFTSKGPGSVCRLDASDTSMTGNGSAVVIDLGPEEECQAKCLAEHSCTGFEYRSTEKRCEIWTKPILHFTMAVHPVEFECKIKTCPI